MPLQSLVRTVPQPPFQIVHSNLQSSGQRPQMAVHGLTGSARINPRSVNWRRFNDFLNSHNTLISMILAIGFGIWGILLTVRYGESKDQIAELKKIVMEQQELNRCFSLFIEQQTEMNDKLYSLNILGHDQLTTLQDARAMTVQESKNLLLEFCRASRFKFNGPNAEFGRIYAAGAINGASEGDCLRYYELAEALIPFLKEMRTQNTLCLQKNLQARQYWQQNIIIYSIQRNTGGCPTLKERERITLDLYEAEKNWDRLIEILEK